MKGVRATSRTGHSSCQLGGAPVPLKFSLLRTSGNEAAKAGTGKDIEPWGLGILSLTAYEEKLRPTVEPLHWRPHSWLEDEQGQEVALTLSSVLSNRAKQPGSPVQG